MSFALVAQTGAQGFTGCTTSAVDTTGANLLVAVLAFYESLETYVGPAISDSNGNVWSGMATFSAADLSLQMFYCFNPTVGSGHTFSSGALAAGLSVVAFSGADTVTPPTGTGADGLAGGGSNIQPGGLGAETGSLFVTGFGSRYLGDQSSLSISDSHSWTEYDLLSSHGGTNCPTSLAWCDTIGTDVANPAWVPGTYTYCVAGMAYFLPSGGGYALTADSGSFTVTGTVATLAVTLSGASATFTLSGTAGSLAAKLAGASGSFTLTGTAAVEKLALGGTAGSFSLTGTAAAEKIAVTGASGSFALSGTAAAERIALAGSSGSFALSGTAAAVKIAMAAGSGSFAVSGTPATLYTPGSGGTSVVALYYNSLLMGA